MIVLVLEWIEAVLAANPQHEFGPERKARLSAERQVLRELAIQRGEKPKKNTQKGESIDAPNNNLLVTLENSFSFVDTERNLVELEVDSLLIIYRRVLPCGGLTDENRMLRLASVHSADSSTQVTIRQDGRAVWLDEREAKVRNRNFVATSK
jgi:hypothetical protein